MCCRRSSGRKRPAPARRVPTLLLAFLLFTATTAVTGAAAPGDPGTDRVPLTTAEQQWIARHPVVRIQMSETSTAVPVPPGRPLAGDVPGLPRRDLPASRPGVSGDRPGVERGPGTHRQGAGGRSPARRLRAARSGRPCSRSANRIWPFPQVIFTRKIAGFVGSIAGPRAQHNRRRERLRDGDLAQARPADGAVSHHGGHPERIETAGERQGRRLCRQPRRRRVSHRQQGPGRHQGRRPDRLRGRRAQLRGAQGLAGTRRAHRQGARLLQRGGPPGDPQQVALAARRTRHQGPGRRHLGAPGGRRRAALHRAAAAGRERSRPRTSNGRSKSTAGRKRRPGRARSATAAFSTPPGMPFSS